MEEKNTASKDDKKNIIKKDEIKKRLYRSRTSRVFAGVCGGLADYFDIDPTWVRLLFILFLFLGGSAILVYLVMWLVVPLEPI